MTFVHLITCWREQRYNAMRPEKCQKYENTAVRGFILWSSTFSGSNVAYTGKNHNIRGIMIRLKITESPDVRRLWRCRKRVCLMSRVYFVSCAACQESRDRINRATVKAKWCNMQPYVVTAAADMMMILMMMMMTTILLFRRLCLELCRRPLPDGNVYCSDCW